MKYRPTIFAALLLIATFATHASSPSQRQPSHAKSSRAHYQPPRTADGKPDLQGVWTNASLTTLERNSRYKSLVIPNNEVVHATATHPQVVRLQTDDALDVGTKRLDGSDLARGRGYNAFWIDPGTTFGLVRGEYRSSWLVDPSNGLLPYSERGNKYRSDSAARHDNFDGPEARPLADRCLMTGGRIGPPMINGLYNNNYQIVQTQDHILILVEMVRHARIVRMNAKHGPANILQLFGDSIGWWQGDTLIVETTNFSPWHRDSFVNISPQGKVIERFTRVSAQQLLYEFTVSDPIFYKQAWRGEMSFNASKDHLYEYACHEGNYAMVGILSGAREQEKRAHASETLSIESSRSNDSRAPKK